jgi:glutamine amidotransferase
MITVINYGAGNLPNVVRALQHVGAQLDVTEDPAAVAVASAVVLPGVGATRDTMDSLRRLGMTEVLPEVLQSGRPFLGICVGMQVLFAQSEEFGEHECLGLLGGRVRRLPDGQKVPQIGWNQVQFTPQAQVHPLLAGIPDGSDFYFVHSYYCEPLDPRLVAGETDYGIRFPSIVIDKNLAAVQFHPEKSGRRGLQLLRNFVALCAEQPVPARNSAQVAR